MTDIRQKLHLQEMTRGIIVIGLRIKGMMKEDKKNDGARHEVEIGLGMIKMTEMKRFWTDGT